MFLTLHLKSSDSTLSFPFKLSSQSSLNTLPCWDGLQADFNSFISEQHAPSFLPFANFCIVGSIKVFFCTLCNSSCTSRHQTIMTSRFTQCHHWLSCWTESMTEWPSGDLWSLDSSGLQAVFLILQNLSSHFHWLLGHAACKKMQKN